MSANSSTLELMVSDVTRQKVRSVENISTQATAGELVSAFIDDLNMPRNDPAGRSLTYRALHRREARHLRPDERLGDSVQSGDWLVLQPSIEAG
jgi:hypothetical protein